MAIDDIIKEFIKIYEDENLVNEIDDNIIDLGIVPAGESRIYKLWVKNDSIHTFTNLEFLTSHEELKILEYPQDLNPKGVGELVIQWTALVDVIESLQTPIRIKGNFITG